MHIDDELIENLRKALHTGSTLELLDAAVAVVAEADRGPQKIMDRDGDVWVRQSDGRWQMEGYLNDGRRVTRDYIEENYGPTRLVN